MADHHHFTTADNSGDQNPGDAGDSNRLVPVFSLRGRDLYSDSDDDLSDLAFDLFHDRRRTSASDPFPHTLDPPNFTAMDEIEPSYLDFGLGLGLGFDRDEIDEGERQIVVSDWAADDFFVGRRSSPSPARSASIEFSRARAVNSEGLRIVGFDSDSDSDEQIVAIGEEGSDGDVGGGLGLPLCWDCLHLDEGRRDLNEDFEWEEVDGGVEESRNVVSVAVLGNEGGGEEVGMMFHDELENEEDVDRTIEWEVLLAVNNLGRSTMVDVESYFDDEQEGFVYGNSDYEAYEVLFGQFAEHDGNIKGSPPAAKSVVDNLPSIMFTEEDIAAKDNVCAVCKDGIVAEENVKRLPCAHYYHGECILPWLKIRNTCPLCRFELPTDDPDYEKWKASRVDGVAFEDEAGLRYDFEVLPDA